MRIAAIVAALYGLLCIAALALIPASAAGWFGLTPEPLVGLFAILLAAPLSLALINVPDLGIAANWAMIMGCMAINALAILAVGRLASRRRGPAARLPPPAR